MSQHSELIAELDAQAKTWNTDVPGIGRLLLAARDALKSLERGLGVPCLISTLDGRLCSRGTNGCALEHGGLSDAEPQNRCITELLAFAKDHPGTYIFPSWDGSRVMKYLATSPQAAQTAVKSESLAQAAQAPARLPSEGKTIEALAPVEIKPDVLYELKPGGVHVFKAQTEAALREMVRLSEDLGLYDADFKPNE